MKTIIFLIISTLTGLLAGCHLEQGKLYFDELNLDPITVYKMAPLETTIYCLAEGDVPEGAALEKMHNEAIKEVEARPEIGNWGQLVCLSLTEKATITQMRETINALQLVISVRHKQANPARGFKKLLEQKIRLQQSIDQGLERIIEEQDHLAEQASSCNQKISEQMDATAVQMEKVINLEKKVQELQEIELLLHPKE